MLELRVLQKARIVRPVEERIHVEHRHPWPVLAAGTDDHLHFVHARMGHRGGASRSRGLGTSRRCARPAPRGSLHPFQHFFTALAGVKHDPTGEVVPLLLLDDGPRQPAGVGLAVRAAEAHRVVELDSHAFVRLDGARRLLHDSRPISVLKKKVVKNSLMRSAHHMSGKVNGYLLRWRFDLPTRFGQFRPSPRFAKLTTARRSAFGS